MTRFACKRGSNDDGNRLVKLVIKGIEIYDTKSTDKAVGFKVNDADMIWFPKSQMTEYICERDAETQTITQVSFWLPAWLVKEKSCECYLDSSYAPSLFDIFDGSGDGEDDQDMYLKGRRDRRGR